MSIEDFIEEQFPNILIDAAKADWINQLEFEEEEEDEDYIESGEWLDNFKELISDSDAVFDLIADWEIFDIRDLESIEYGASKIVFIAKNFVYKVVLDSCSLQSSEFDIYSEAERSGLGDYFARTSSEHEVLFYDTSIDEDDFFYSISWYKQERIRENRLGRKIRWNAAEGEEVCWDKMSRSSRRVYSERYSDDSYYSVLANTGFSDIGKLNKFLSDRCINDLHTGNFRMRQNVPVLIDFSGFC